MFEGKISKTGTQVEGSLRMQPYRDIWLVAHAITFDGELTPEVCAAIEKSWKEYNSQFKAESSYGNLRWSSPDTFVRVDVEMRAVIVECTQNLCD